jgi:hypothetical protein
MSSQGDNVTVHDTDTNVNNTNNNVHQIGFVHDWVDYLSDSKDKIVKWNSEDGFTINFSQLFTDDAKANNSAAHEAVNDLRHLAYLLELEIPVGMAYFLAASGDEYLYLADRYGQPGAGWTHFSTRQVLCKPIPSFLWVKKTTRGEETFLGRSNLRLVDRPLQGHTRYRLVQAADPSNFGPNKNRSVYTKDSPGPAKKVPEPAFEPENTFQHD